MVERNAPENTLARRLANLFASLSQVEAVALGGSRGSGAADVTSDIDVYVYTQDEIPLEEREALLVSSGGASRASMGLIYWGSGDMWVDAATGIEVDVVYFETRWIASQLQRVMHEHQANLGYTTAFWRTVRYSQSFYDPRGWFENLQYQSRQPYPEALRHNIITANHAVLRGIIPAYLYQLEKAVLRQDEVSINHRVAALLASYFDILFALNYVLHPGEKRLIDFALSECSKLPTNMAEDVQAVLHATGTGAEQLLRHVRQLLDRLDNLLEQEGFAI